MQVGLALGGGGMRGIAHIGVLAALEQEGFQVSAISGTSIGGLVGAIYAAGYRPKEIVSIFESVRASRLYSRQPSDGPSLLGLAGLTEALADVLGETDFRDLKIPFACTAVDLHTAQEVYLNSGRLIDAVLATIAIPGVFPPRTEGAMQLVDGAVLDPVPVRLARCLNPRLPVVAVPLTPAREEWHRLPEFHIISPHALPLPTPLVEGIARLRVGQALRIFLQSMDVTARMLTELRLEAERPDVIVRPEVYQYGVLDDVVPGDLVQAGYRAGMRAMPRVRRSVSWLNTIARVLRAPAPRRQPVTNIGALPAPAALPDLPK